MKENSFSITKKTKKTLPVSESFFKKIKEKVLGKNYSLSVVFVGTALSKKLNFKYRKINKPTDILSFEIAKNEGEIFINPDKAKIKAKLHSRDFKNYLHFLFIHGLVHLKGMDHGSRMESEEKKFRKFFGI